MIFIISLKKIVITNSTASLRSLGQKRVRFTHQKYYNEYKSKFDFPSTNNGIPNQLLITDQQFEINLSLSRSSLDDPVYSVGPFYRETNHFPFVSFFSFPVVVFQFSSVSFVPEVGRRKILKLPIAFSIDRHSMSCDRVFFLYGAFRTPLYK